MFVKIDGQEYKVNDTEFVKIPHDRFSNLVIRDDVGKFERLISLINELNCLKIENLVMYNTTHGGFIPIKCSQNYENVFAIETSVNHVNNIMTNIDTYKINNITLKKYLDNIENINKNSVFIVSENDCCLDMEFIQENKPLLLTCKNNYLINSIYKNTFNLTNTNLVLYVPDHLFLNFSSEFCYFINENGDLDYDNLNHLSIMVKNGGPQFEQMLIDNLPFFDRWTILDTGSTDETISTINRVLVGKKKGQLFQEPFINFRDSRNRCLELTGSSCKFITMLDDTYVIQGNLRGFLNEVRGDQLSSSFTMYIHSNDTIYGSNRIIRSNTGLRYIHKIHEVITDKNNVNIVIPKEITNIDDRRFDYMEKRTHNRKQLDLKLLYEEVEENPHDPRAYYYLAQTYNLLEDYEKAFYYFMKRCEFINSGFLQERVDAAFESARIANFKLNKPWSECEELYNKAFKIDESRPETQYFIGIHYYLENNLLLAYKYLKKSFEIGFPLHCQYSLKPTLSFHFLPKFLARTCYQPCIEDFKLGEEASIFFLQNNKSTDNDYEEMVSWYKIFNKLNSFNPNTDKIVTIKSNKPFFVYIADGGFNQWTGSTILEKGVGGSETYIIEMARYIQQCNKFQTVVFCNTPNNLEEFFEDVIYKPLTEYASFIKNNKVHTCFISRFSEYLPLTYKSLVKNIYLVLHDLTASGNVIPIEPSLKRIFCLSEWHAEYYSNIMPALKHLITPFYYGIDINKFINNNIKKTPYKFIYSSFPNRGLLPLLQMWKHIVEIQPLSQLHIYSDINGKWVNEVAPEQIKEIKLLLDFYNYNNDNNKSNKYNIFLHGWVSKDKLAEAWQSSDIWFYPCTFMETFCLTALEAAITNTLVVTNDLAALQNTVGNRGVIINGDPMTKEWQDKTIDILTPFLQNNITNNELKEQLINTNYNWAKNLTWKNQANKMLDEYILPTLITNNNLESNKNLIYICVFGKEEYIQLTNLLLHSLYLYGNVNSSITDLLVYTNSNFKNIIEKNISWIKYFNINFVINDSINTKLDACKSRFNIFNFDLVNKYNNILYLDTDIIINNDINVIFELCKEDKLYASCEAGFKINDPIHGNNWGKRLFTQDELNNIEDKNGFNSGVLLFKNGPNVRKIFNNILKDTRNLIETEIYDQEFLNYHFITASLVDKYLLELYTKNICNNPVGDLNYNKTILHFYVQGFDEKLRMMNAFLNNKKEQFINQTIIKAKEIIVDKLVPIIAEIGESLEGCFFSDHLSNTITNHRIDNVNGVCDILINKSVRNVLEIGFNAGFSSLLILLINPHINLTCVDICEHQYTMPCYEHIKSIFPNRITLIKGSSEFVLPELVKEGNKYDMIHIDGGHSNRIFFHDTQNSIKLINKDGILLIDDYDFHYIKVIWDLFVDYYGFKKYREIKTQSAYIV